MSHKCRISACMIVRNEEQFLTECLDSLKGLADEIIVVDTGSQDNTVEIARNAGACVSFYEWNDSFSDARNNSIGAASGDWILIIDADERVDKSAHSVIRNAVTNADYDAFMVNQLNYYSEDAADNITNPTCRIFRNIPKYRYMGRVHESIIEVIKQHNGTIGYLNALIHHYGNMHDIICERNKAYTYRKILEAELADNPNDVYQIYNLAMSYYVAENYDETIRHLLKAAELVNINSNMAGWIYKTLISSYFILGDYESAIKTTKHAIMRGIHHPEIYFTCGQSHMSLKHFSKAVKMLQEAIAIGNKCQWMGDSATWGWKAHLGIANSLLHTGDFNGAVKHARIVLKDKPNSQSTHGVIADAYAHLGEEENASKHMHKYAVLHSDPARGWIELGIYFGQRNRPNESLDCFINAINFDNNCAEAYFNAADILYYNSEYTMALDLYSNGLRLTPDHAPGFFMLGNCYAQMESFDAAEMAYTQALIINPEYDDARSNLEYVREQKGISQAA